MTITNNISRAISMIQNGDIIAYPTEAVFGLGCDPFNARAVERLIALKNRDVLKGLIILISSWEQFHQLTRPIPEKHMQQIKQTWPGHVSWILPKSELVPDYLTGSRDTIALRMSAHPVAYALCEAGPLISTSANISGQEPAKSMDELSAQFPKGIDGIVEGALGGAQRPSQIFNAMTGEKLR